MEQFGTHGDADLVDVAQRMRLRKGKDRLGGVVREVVQSAVAVEHLECGKRPPLWLVGPRAESLALQPGREQY